MGLDEKWLHKKVKEEGYKNEKEIFLGLCDENNELRLYKSK